MSLCVSDVSRAKRKVHFTRLVGGSWEAIPRTMHRHKTFVRISSLPMILNYLILIYKGNNSWDFKHIC